jgi:hypothetical protein
VVGGCRSERRDLSPPSHRVPRRPRTQASVLDARWTLTCGNGFSITAWTLASSLGVKGSRVQIPPSRRFFEQPWDHFGTTASLIRRSGRHSAPRRRPRGQGRDRPPGRSWQRDRAPCPPGHRPHHDLYGRQPYHGTDVFVGDQDELAEVRWVTLAQAEDLMQPHGMFRPVREFLARSFG